MSAAVERLNEREESREPSRIIADARGERRPVTLFDGHIRAFREHGVKMGGDDELGLAGGAFADSNNVALLVEGCISEPDLPRRVGWWAFSARLFRCYGVAGTGWHDRRRKQPTERPMPQPNDLRACP